MLTAGGRDFPRVADTAGQGPACFLMPQRSLGDPGLLSARWRITSSEPLGLLAQLIGDGTSRAISFRDGSVTVRLRALRGSAISFTAQAGGLSLCRARLWPAAEGGTGVEVTYRREYGKRLLTVPEGIVLLEVLMGYTLPSDSPDA